MPPFENLLLPVLRLVVKSNVTKDHVTLAMIKQYLVPKRQHSVFVKRMTWVFSYLRSAGFIIVISTTKRVLITVAGKQFVQKAKNRINVDRIDLILASDEFALRMKQIELNRCIGRFDMRVVQAVEKRLGCVVAR